MIFVYMMSRAVFGSRSGSISGTRAPIESIAPPSILTGLDLARRDKPVVPEPVSISFPAVPDAIPASEPSPDTTVESVESVKTPRVSLEKLRAVSAFTSESPPTAPPPENATPISLSTMTKVMKAFVSPYHKETVEAIAANNAEGIPKHLRDKFRIDGLVALASLIDKRATQGRNEISPEMLHFIISLRAFNTPHMIIKDHSKTRANILTTVKQCDIESRLLKIIKRILNHVCGIKDTSKCDELISEIQSLCPGKSLKESVLRFFTTFAYTEKID